MKPMCSKFNFHQSSALFLPTRYLYDSHLRPLIGTIDTIPVAFHKEGSEYWRVQGIYQLLMNFNSDCLTNCNSTFYYTIYLLFCSISRF